MTPERKSKRAEYMRKWRTEDPVRWKAIAGPARAKWKATHRAEHREVQRNHRHAVRIEILSLIGGGRVECNRCSFSDWRALQIDHINGGGARDERTKQGNWPMWRLRTWLIENLEEGRRLYQVLCANCNWIKRHENNELGRIMRGGSDDA